MNGRNIKSWEGMRDELDGQGHMAAEGVHNWGRNDSVYGVRFGLKTLFRGEYKMEKYKSTPQIIDAITRAAIRSGSFKQLAAEISLPTMILTLITDAAMTELSKNTLEALMPKIREFLPGEEKNNILEFLSVKNGGRK